MVSRRADVASHEISPGVTVLLDLISGMYYSLEAVASRVWQLLEERPHTVEDMARVIANEHEIVAEQCNADLIAFVNDLAHAGLVEISGLANR
jgi:hypothetical protein